MSVQHSSASLLMSLPVFTWLFYWSTFWHPLQAKAGEGAMYSQNAAQDISLHFFLHWCSSNLGTNLCVVVAKIDELPDWESASVHSWGNNKSPGLLSRRAPWRVACVRASSPLPCLPHLSSKFSLPLLFLFSLWTPPTSPPTSTYPHFYLQWKGKLCPAVGVQGTHTGEIPFIQSNGFHSAIKMPENRSFLTLPLRWLCIGRFVCRLAHPNSKITEAEITKGRLVDLCGSSCWILRVSRGSRGARKPPAWPSEPSGRRLNSGLRTVT